MYCPHCGVNNDRGEPACFICHKPMPSFDAPAATSPRSRVESRDTPQHSIASVGDRMIALFFDRLIIASLLLVTGAWAGDRWTGYRFDSPLLGAAALGGTFFAAVFLYHFVSEAALLTTIGKAAMGLHIGLEEGRSRLAGTALRNILRVVDSIGFYAIGFLFATFTRRRQRVGDLVGRTVVLEWPIARGGRAAVMLLIIATIAGAVWIASEICPTCSSQLTRDLGAIQRR